MHRIAQALTKGEIVAIVRDYVRDWHPGDLGQLAQECREEIFNPTERYVVASACARLAELDSLDKH